MTINEALNKTNWRSLRVEETMDDINKGCVKSKINEPRKST